MFTAGLVAPRTQSPAHDQKNVFTTVEVETGEGSAMVWLNSLPHRVRKLSVPASVGSAKVRRSFVNFFFVDPSK